MTRYKKNEGACMDGLMEHGLAGSARSARAEALATIRVLGATITSISDATTNLDVAVQAYVAHPSSDQAAELRSAIDRVRRAIS